MYVQPNVKIELGARSDDWPREVRSVTPYVAEQFPAAFTIPSCEVAVLEAERTFWEKATLLHSYCHCPLDKLIPPRLSRHYYDLALLIDHGIGIKRRRGWTCWIVWLRTKPCSSARAGPTTNVPSRAVSG